MSFIYVIGLKIKKKCLNKTFALQKKKKNKNKKKRKERVEKPKGNNGVTLEKRTKGRYSIQNIGERVLKH